MKRSRGGVAGVAALVAPLLAAGCSEGVVSVSTGELAGRWTWVRSTGGIAGRTLTPETEGFTGVLRFGLDHTVEWAVDGEVRWSTTYTLGRGREGSAMAGRDVVRYGEPAFGWEEQAVEVELGRDGTPTLTLTDPCCDGYVHEYVREGP